MSTENPGQQPILSYSTKRARRWWLWTASLIFVLAVLGGVTRYVLIPAYSIHKGRELNIQAGILKATPRPPVILREWEPAKASGEEQVENWMRGPNVYDQVDTKSSAYPILRAAMLDGFERRVAMVWFDSERTDGFDIEYAIVKPGGRFYASRLLNSGTFAFQGGQSTTPIRVWSGVFVGDDRTRFQFDFEIAGARSTATATLANSTLTFVIAPSPGTE